MHLILKLSVFLKKIASKNDSNLSLDELVLLLFIEPHWVFFLGGGRFLGVGGYCVLIFVLVTYVPLAQESIFLHKKKIINMF